MPEDFIDSVNKLNARENALDRARTPAQPPRRRTNSGANGYVAQALLNEAENVRKATKGTRNDTLNTAGFNVGQLVQPGGLTFEQARDELYRAARDSGLSARELKQTELPERAIRAGMEKLRDIDEIVARETDTGAAIFIMPPPPDEPTDLEFEYLEDGFWLARPSLENIYLSSLSRMCSPWAVLACCAARALALVPPTWTLPDLIGGPGSLNWFGAITAVSGGGKGAASATAKALVNDFVLQRNTGSGEGIIAAYVRPKDGDTPAGLQESVMFMVDEIDSLTAQTKRSGATTMPVLRSAFSGETLGFSYVNKNTPTLDAHSYRLTLIASVQPARAADLLSDADGGTPQRFMWFPGTDKRINAEMAGGFIDALDLPSRGEFMYPTQIQIPSVARELILRERVKAQQGRAGALDGHALFCREKFAFALAVLDGRTFMTEQDWELSGIAAKVSDATREYVAGMVETARTIEATERGRLHGISNVAADEEKSYRIDEKRARVTANVLKYFRAAAQQGLSVRELKRKLGREYTWADTILQQLAADDAVRFDDDRKRWCSTEFD